MTRKRTVLIVLAVILGASMMLGGCNALQQYMADLLDTDSSAPLPTLPDSSDMAVDTSIIPMDVIMQPMEYTPPSISADGTKILYRHMEGYIDTVVVEEWRTGEATRVEWPRELRGVPYYYWAPDSETILFFSDIMGDENRGLYISNYVTGETKTILTAGDNDCQYVSNNPDNEKEIYIRLFDYEAEAFDLYLINYETGSKKLILENPGDITNMIFDHDGNLRVVNRIDDNASVHVWTKKETGSDNTRFRQSEWSNILSWDYKDAKTSGVFGFMQDDLRLMYMDSSQSNTATLYTYNTQTGEKEAIYNDPDYEIYGMWSDIEMDKVVAVSVYRDKAEWEILDPSFQDHFDVLSAEQSGVFDIIDSSEDDRYWLVMYSSDVKMSDHYVYDMQTHQMTYLYNEMEALADYDFAPKQPISYTSGDGLDIEGYATFPLDMEKQNLPVVVVVHGGPWARDIWGFDHEAQLLANRGYLVLQFNFRGSSGYGRDFLLAGDKEWGRAMHQDILDGVQYAVDMGWADEDRIGVYGASYGGYEALICAAFSSDVFQCAVDAFGPSSLLTFVDSIPPQWAVVYQDLIRSIGDPETEADLMRERSPLYFAEDIDIPMLIAQGSNDIRVVQAESDQMVAALEDAGVPVTYMLFQNTGHGFSSIESRMQFYTEMERFFSEHLRGRSE